MCSGKPKIKFRSYNPQTEELKEQKLPKAKPEEGTQLSSVIVIVLSWLSVGFPHKKMKFFKTSQNSGRMKMFLD